MLFIALINGFLRNSQFEIEDKKTGEDKNIQGDFLFAIIIGKDVFNLLIDEI